MFGAPFSLPVLHSQPFRRGPPDVKTFCVHSLRSGGASAAANNGVKDRIFKRHGRWASETAKDGYVKDDIDERLKVSLSLGL